MLLILVCFANLFCMKLDYILVNDRYDIGFNCVREGAWATTESFPFYLREKGKRSKVQKPGDECYLGEVLLVC